MPAIFSSLPHVFTESIVKAPKSISGERDRAFYGELVNSRRKISAPAINSHILRSDDSHKEREAHDGRGVDADSPTARPSGRVKASERGGTLLGVPVDLCGN